MLWLQKTTWCRFSILTALYYVDHIASKSKTYEHNYKPVLRAVPTVPINSDSESTGESFSFSSEPVLKRVSQFSQSYSFSLIPAQLGVDWVGEALTWCYGFRK